jgi:Subtilase family
LSAKLKTQNLAAQKILSFARFFCAIKFCFSTRRKFLEQQNTVWISLRAEVYFRQVFPTSKAMSNLSKIKTALIFVFAAFFCETTQAQYLDQIGLTTLRAMTTNLDGAGVKVGQAEALAPQFEVNPGAVGQSANLFTWIATTSSIVDISSYFPPPATSGAFTNSLGVESGHANNVGADFYGIPGGVATNVAHVNNYDAETFYYHYVYYNNAIAERIVNQSFTFRTNDDGVSTNYDNYAAQHGVLFVSGAGFNNNPVWSPATCYNGIGVGVFNNSGSPYGPTADGRSKPDITAPGVQDTVSSYSTPLVSGAAALLLQAGLRGDGGGDTNSATDIRTLKALLLNGAAKPTDWINAPSTPLHPRYGAGVLNVFNSYEQLAGGKHGYNFSTNISTGSPHPPPGDTNTVGVLNGWDFNTNSSSTLNDGVNHYYFNVANSLSNAAFTFTTTLVWNRQQNQTNINNLDLFLYDAVSSNLITCSTSLVDNVEHIFVPRLAQGRYDLQVLKKGGTTVSPDETYALAFGFFAQNLSITQSGTNAILSWPVYPAGFSIVTTTNLAPANWIPFTNIPAVITNQQNQLQFSPSNASQFFRLQQP